MFLFFAKGEEIIGSLMSSLYSMDFACVAALHVSSWWVP